MACKIWYAVFLFMYDQKCHVYYVIIYLQPVSIENFYSFDNFFLIYLSYSIDFCKIVAQCLIEKFLPLD